MYNGYPNRISNQQLLEQADLLQDTEAKRRAALALDLDPDWPSKIKTEMSARIWLALGLIDDDHGDRCPCDDCNPPMPNMDDGGELPY